MDIMIPLDVVESLTPGWYSKKKLYALIEEIFGETEEPLKYVDVLPGGDGYIILRWSLETQLGA